MLALPRLTVKKSTKIAAFQQVVHGRDVQRIYVKDRLLTKGWAMARRTKAALSDHS